MTNESKFRHETVTHCNSGAPDVSMLLTAERVALIDFYSSKSRYVLNSDDALPGINNDNGSPAYTAPRDIGPDRSDESRGSAYTHLT